MKHVFPLVFLLALFSTAPAQKISLDSLDTRVPKVINALLSALLEENPDSGFAHCVELIDTTMYRLYPQKMKFSYVSGHEGAGLYAFPADIRIVDQKNKNWKGAWLDVYIGYKDGLAGDPRIVRIFLPSDGSAGRILNFSDL